VTFSKKSSGNGEKKDKHSVVSYGQTLSLISMCLFFISAWEQSVLSPT
jgi:hypothetical protein